MSSDDLRRRESAGSKTLDTPRDPARSALTQTVRRERTRAEEERLVRSESKKGSSRRRASALDDAALPDSYPALVSDLEKRIAGARLRAALSVNRELILLYFHHRSALF